MVLGSFGQFWAVKGGFKPSFGHRPAQNRFWTAQNRTLCKINECSNIISLLHQHVVVVATDEEEEAKEEMKWKRRRKGMGSDSNGDSDIQ